MLILHLFAKLTSIHYIVLLVSLLRRLVKLVSISHLNVIYTHTVCADKTSDTGFHLSIAIDNEMDVASSTFFSSK